MPKTIVNVKRTEKVRLRNRHSKERLLDIERAWDSMNDAYEKINSDRKDALLKLSQDSLKSVIFFRSGMEALA
jgi:hypothetical protein